MIVADFFVKTENFLDMFVDYFVTFDYSKP